MSAPHFIDALHGILFLFMQMSVDAALPGATISIEDPATPAPSTLPTGLKFNKTKEPAAEVCKVLFLDLCFLIPSWP
jgi:hypothetical protein